MEEKVAVIGLGYVGLPVALAFARKFNGAVGFDIHQEKVDELRRGFDRNHEVPAEVLKSTTLNMTADPKALVGRIVFYVVAVPTPVDSNNVPDLTPVMKASETVGKSTRQGWPLRRSESTVYPGVGEDVCGSILEKLSGLKCGSTPTLRLLLRSGLTPATRSTLSSGSPRSSPGRTARRSIVSPLPTARSSTPASTARRASRSRRP